MSVQVQYICRFRLCVYIPESFGLCVIKWRRNSPSWKFTDRNDNNNNNNEKKKAADNNERMWQWQCRATTTTTHSKTTEISVVPSIVSYRLRMQQLYISLVCLCLVTWYTSFSPSQPSAHRLYSFQNSLLFPSIDLIYVRTPFRYRMSSAYTQTPKHVTHCCMYCTDINVGLARGEIYFFIVFIPVGSTHRQFESKIVWTKRKSTRSPIFQEGTNKNKMWFEKKRHFFFLLFELINSNGTQKIVSLKMWRSVCGETTRRIECRRKSNFKSENGMRENFA